MLSLYRTLLASACITRMGDILTFLAPVELGGNDRSGAPGGARGPILGRGVGFLLGTRSNVGGPRGSCREARDASGG